MKEFKFAIYYKEKLIAKTINWAKVIEFVQTQNMYDMDELTIKKIGD